MADDNDWVWRRRTNGCGPRFEFASDLRDDGDSYWREFWDGPMNAVAVGFAAGGLGLGTLLAAVAGEFSVLSAIPYGFGLGGAIWLPMNWSRWKRGLW